MRSGEIQRANRKSDSALPVFPSYCFFPDGVRIDSVAKMEDAATGRWENMLSKKYSCRFISLNIESDIPDIMGQPKLFHSPCYTTYAGDLGSFTLGGNYK